MRPLLTSLLLASSVAIATQPGSARAEFMRANLCPGPDGSCKGWEIDRRMPLCAGEREEAGNYRWLSRAEAREKARQDAELCRRAEKP